MGSNEPEEPTLLQRIARGDETAVQRVIDQFGGLVWSLARRFSRSTTDAEDAVQEVFIEIWSNAGRYDRSIASEATFVAMLARRRLIDRLRRQGRHPTEEPLSSAAELAGPGETFASDQVALTEESARAAQFLSQLRPEQQRVLRLSIYDGWSHQRISDYLGLPLGTVKTHVRRGLIQLREKLGIPRDAGATAIGGAGPRDGGPSPAGASEGVR
ncbi:MAG: RNA polymerase sigma factor [Planctomycetota bacterium]